jgi:hypothetical protein
MTFKTLGSRRPPFVSAFHTINQCLAPGIRRLLHRIYYLFTVLYQVLYPTVPEADDTSKEENSNIPYANGPLQFY